MPIKPITPQEYESNTKASSSSTRAVKKAVPVAAPLTPDGETYVRSIDPTDPNYNRHILPSRGFFYAEKKDIIFRAFKVGDLKKIQLFLQTDNITHLIDAIQNCLESGVDVRDLTFQDFLFIVFKIVFSSHPTPEYKFTWNSFYGNECEEIITPNSLEIQELNYKLLIEQLPDLADLGFTPCLVKHYEMLHNNRYNPEDDTTWEEEKTWLYDEIAKFLDEPTVADQLARAEDMPVNSPEYTKLKLFKTLCGHSIKTELQVFDRSFEPNKALATLTERLESLQAVRLDSEDVYQQISTASPVMNIDAVKQEILRIETALTLSREVRAKDEVTPFRINIESLVRPLFT